MWPPNARPKPPAKVPCDVQSPRGNEAPGAVVSDSASQHAGCKEDIGSTFITVVTRYATRLRDVGARLILVGVSNDVHHQLRNTGALAAIGDENVFRGTRMVGESLRNAIDDACQWIDASE